MATLADRVLEVLKQGPLDDDQLAGRLDVIRQQVNQVCRQLVSRGLLIREAGGRAKIMNRVAQGAVAAETVCRTPSPVVSEDLPQEDGVKAAVRQYLEARG